MELSLKSKTGTYNSAEEYFDFICETSGYPPLYKKFETDNIISDGLKLHLDVYNFAPSSPTVVFIPGTAIYSMCYAEILYLLGKSGYNIVAFDPRGHGRSEGERGVYSIEELMVDTKNVISFAIERFNEMTEALNSQNRRLMKRQSSHGGSKLFCLNLPRKGAKARGRWLPKQRRMRVLQGSTVARSAAESLPHEYHSLRNRLIRVGIIVEQEGEFRFTRDYIFDSASEAASVVAGNSRSGFESWKDSKGRTLQQLGIKR